MNKDLIDFLAIAGILVGGSGAIFLAFYILYLLLIAYGIWAPALLCMLVGGASIATAIYGQKRLNDAKAKEKP